MTASGWGILTIALCFSVMVIETSALGEQHRVFGAMPGGGVLYP